MILGLVGRLLESQVVLYGPARILSLLILPGRNGRGDDPESGQKREGGEEGQEECCLQSATDLPREIQWDTAENGKEQSI